MKKYIGMLFMAGIVLALTQGTLLCDDKILPIRSVPDILSPEAAQTQEPEEFHGKGEVFRIGKDEVGESIIVIDDRLKYFAQKARFYDVDKSPLKFSNFYRGNQVGYMLDSKSHITSLYLLEK